MGRLHSYVHIRKLPCYKYFAAVDTEAIFNDFWNIYNIGSNKEFYNVYSGYVSENQQVKMTSIPSPRFIARW